MLISLATTLSLLTLACYYNIVCLLQSAVCLLQVPVMTELEGERYKLFKTSKIIKIGLEYKELEQNEDCSVLGSFGNTEC